MIISVVIPTCDRNELILETVNSVLSQTVKPFEIIIVNNGKQKVALPEAISGNIKVFNIMQYAGVAQARNFGASVAQGKYVAFLDDDDLWDKNYLENVQDAIERGAEVIVSRLDKLEGEKISLYKNADNKINVKSILVYNPGITGSNLVIKKQVFNELSGFDPKLPPSEDKSLVLEAVRHSKKIVMLPENQAIIRMHQGVRLTDSKKMAEGIFQFIKKYKIIMNRFQLIQNWLKVYKYRYESGYKFSFIPFAATYIVVRFLKLLKKI